MRTFAVWRWTAPTLACAVLLLAVQAACAETPDLLAPLPVDPSVRMSRLPNGMACWVRSNKTPPGKVSFFLHVGSGSTNETDAQRGLAHFLEHMAFDGSEHFPPGTLIKYFESIGLRFGHDQNAFTSFDQTTYSLTLPDGKEETLAKGLQCLADYGFRVTFEPEQIKKECGVVLEEVRARKGAGQRILDKYLPLLLPGSRVAERLPIGKEEVVRAADRDAFLAYYRKWYRPDDTTLIVVGDVDAVLVERLAAAEFKDWKPTPDPAPDADPGIQPYLTTRAGVITDPEFPQTEVALERVVPYQPDKTVGDFRVRLLDGLAAWIFNRRLSDLIQRGQAPFQEAYTTVSPFLNVALEISATAVGKPGDWQPLLRSLTLEVKRAREYGFLPQELEDARKSTLASAQQAARTEPTLESRALLGGLNGAVSQKRTPLSAAQRLALLEAFLPGVTLDEVTAAFRRRFGGRRSGELVRPDPTQWLVRATVPEKADLPPPAAEQLLAVVREAEGTAVEPLTAKVRPRSLLEQDPPPAGVAQQEEDPELKILTVQLENGVRVHLRSMDFKKDQVWARICVGGGEIRETAAHRGISEAAALALRQKATAQFDSVALRDLMTGKNVNVSGHSGEDEIVLDISGSPQDLPDGFRLAYLLLTGAKLEDAALKVWKQGRLQDLQEKRTSVEDQMWLRKGELLSSGDARHLELTPAQVEGQTVAAAQAWLDGVLRNGPVEAVIVGDMPREKMGDLARRFLGALPRRAPADPELDKLRPLPPVNGPLEATVAVPTVTPRAVVLTGWRGCEWRAVKDRRVLSLAKMILDSRLHDEIRVKRSLTYGAGCISEPGLSYPGMGFFAAYFTADPEKAAGAAQVAREVIESLVREGPTEAEMEKVRKQLRNDLETRLKEPSYWLSTLADMDYRGTRLADVKEVLPKMVSYTREDMLEVLKKYVTPERKLQVIALPKKP